MKPFLKARFRALVSLLGVALGFYVGCVRPFRLRGTQVGTHADFQTLDRWLEIHHEECGEYPLELTDALPSAFWMPRQGGTVLDRWGHPLGYLSDGEMFLLISYGRDGIADGLDYFALRELGHNPDGWEIAYDWDADEVLSDKGWHRNGGK